MLTVNNKEQTMNERIRELAEQAKGFVDLNQHVGGEKGCMVYTYDGLEKFAELIVRESIVDFYRNCLDITSNEDIAVQVERYVQEHFGVK
jgi:hypothetical protein